MECTPPVHHTESASRLQTKQGGKQRVSLPLNLVMTPVGDSRLRVGETWAKEIKRSPSKASLSMGQMPQVTGCMDSVFSASRGSTRGSTRNTSRNSTRASGTSGKRGVQRGACLVFFWTWFPQLPSGALFSFFCFFFLEVFPFKLNQPKKDALVFPWPLAI